MYYCPRGPMDKASDYESGDCGFESHRGCFCKRFSVIFGSSGKKTYSTYDSRVVPHHSTR